MNSLHPFPYLDKTIYFRALGNNLSIRLQTILYALTFSKTYLILRNLALHTKYKNLESQFYW